jgi:hypothetical protein
MLHLCQIRDVDEWRTIKYRPHRVVRPGTEALSQPLSKWLG